MPLFIGFQHHPRWCKIGISAINSSIPTMICVEKTYLPKGRHLKHIWKIPGIMVYGWTAFFWNLASVGPRILSSQRAIGVSQN